MTSVCLKTSGAILKLKTPSRYMLLPSTTTSILINKVHTTTVDTIDPVDIKHLSKFARSWWDPEGPIKPLHAYNFIRVPFVRDSLVTITPNTPQSTCLSGKKILDVGCGPGLLSEDLAKLGADITGIDPCKEFIQSATEHATFNSSLTNKPSYIHTTIEEHIKKHTEEYDAVVASEVIEHINTSQREIFLELCVKALKPGGKIIITTPNRTRMSQLLGIYLVEGLNIVPRGTHHYSKFSTPEEIKYWLELNNCRVELIRGYAYYFWAHKWRWINWQSLGYGLRAVKLDKTAINS